MQGSVISITPAMASKMLQSNAKFQRVLRKKSVVELTQAIQRGEWKLTHQGIAFDTNGDLIDGQHRLMAIAASGVTVPMFVVKDVSTEAFIVLDTGKVRDTADLLSISSKDANIVSFFSRISAARGMGVSSAQKEKLYAHTSVQIKAVSAATTGKRNIFHNTAFQAGTALAIYERPEQKDYILDLYRKMGGMDIEALPPVAQTAVRKCLSGDIRQGASGECRQVLFAVAMFVMNEENKMSKKIPSKPLDALEIVQAGRNILRQFY